MQRSPRNAEHNMANSFATHSNAKMFCSFATRSAAKELLMTTLSFLCTTKAVLITTPSKRRSLVTNEDEDLFHSMATPSVARESSYNTKN